MGQGMHKLYFFFCFSGLISVVNTRFGSLRKYEMVYLWFHATWLVTSVPRIVHNNGGEREMACPFSSTWFLATLQASKLLIVYSVVLSVFADVTPLVLAHR